MLQDMLREGLISVEGYLKVTDKGLKLLVSRDLDKVEFDYVDEEEVFTEPVADFSEIYIPKRFNSKFK